MLGAHEAEVLAQDLEQGVVHGGEDLARFAVHLEADADFLRFAHSSADVSACACGLRAHGACPRIESCPRRVDVTCPCCGAVLKVDPELGTVIWADAKKAPAKDFDDLVNRVHSQRSGLDEKFARSVEQNKRSKDILDKKFEEARRRAAADPTGKPPNPFDND